MRVVVISNKNTKWETLARATAKEAAVYCNDYDGFIRYFSSVLKDRKRETTAHISDSYKAELGSFKGESCVLITHNTANKRIVCVVYEREDAA